LGQVAKGGSFADIWLDYLKLLIDGVSSKGFSAITLPMVGEKTGNAEQVIALSRTRYGRAAESQDASVPAFAA
jgi:hypothetical protein